MLFASSGRKSVSPRKGTGYHPTSIEFTVPEQLRGIVAHPEMANVPFIVGMVVAALSGVASIGFLLKYMQKKISFPCLVPLPAW
ncbi:MAG TPA: undecaprenyl-diphosphate phosphatase [Syntrophomonadaceae bacterium]|nr:undecaprenyl-diphosphate phosphatase [Syntrophomonadaceae bacterium]